MERDPINEAAEWLDGTADNLMGIVGDDDDDVVLDAFEVREVAEKMRSLAANLKALTPQ